jgi:hypothetical protein
MEEEVDFSVTIPVDLPIDVAIAEGRRRLTITTTQVRLKLSKDDDVARYVDFAKLAATRAWPVTSTLRGSIGCSTFNKLNCTLYHGRVKRRKAVTIHEE